MPSRTSLVRQRYKREVSRYGFILCGICRLAISSPRDLTVDHIIPKAKGGTSRVTNLQPAHQLCNQAKADTFTEHLNPWEIGE